MPRAALIAVALCLAACAIETEYEPPSVERLYRIDAQGVTCDDAVSMAAEPPGAPTSITCAWERVQYGGEPHCYVLAVFERETPESPWGAPAVFPSSASCD